MNNIKTQFSNKYLTKLIVPLVISTFLANSVGIIDTLMISSLDESCVSGVSLVDQICVLIINIFAALATGGAVVTAQLLGASKTDTAYKSAKQLIFAGFFISAIFAAVCVIFNNQIISLCFPKLDQATKQAAVTYFFITAFSYPFIAVENCCGALFRSFGKSNYCMYSSLVCNIVNIIGNSLTIYILKMGVAGAAIATTVGRFIAMMLMLLWISDKKSPVRIKLFERFSIDFKLISRILRIGIPSGMENGVFQLGRLLVVSIIANYGLVQTTANAVANNLDSFGCIFGTSMNLAVITIIGQCIGASDFEGVKYYSKKLLLIEYGFGALFYLSTIIFINPILSWYNLDPETASLAKTLVFIHNGIGALIWPLSFTVPNFLRAANDVKFTMIISITSMLLCRLGLSYILHITLELGAIGVWIGMIIDWIFRLSFFVTRFYKGTWKKFCT
jgi:putative MATE family efflux protein